MCIDFAFVLMVCLKTSYFISAIYRPTVQPLTRNNSDTAGTQQFFLLETKIENGQYSCFSNVEEQLMLTRISAIGLTDDELEDNICIKKYVAIGECGKFKKVK